MSPTKTVLDHDLSGDAAHNIQDLTAGRGWPTGAADALRRQDLADHVDGSTITWDAGTGKMSSAGGGSTGVASWDITKCRYIFVDPINGDDSRLGYIDAAPGSTFTALQVLAVSVKTTHRINEIRPIVGAGRMCVVLIGANGNQTAQGIISVAPPSFYTDGDSIVMPTGVGTATIDMRFQVTSGYSPIPGTITLDLRPFLVGDDYTEAERPGHPRHHRRVRGDRLDRRGRRGGLDARAAVPVQRRPRQAHRREPGVRVLVRGDVPGHRA